MNIAGNLLGGAIRALLSLATHSVASAAAWLLDQLGGLMSATTEVPLDTRWFSQHYAVMAAIAATVALPLVCCTAIQAVIRQDASVMTRAVLVNLPLSLIFTGAAVELVSIALKVTDDLSNLVLANTGADAANVLAPLAGALAAGTIMGVVPGLVAFIGCLMVVLATLGLWFELAIRAAAVSAAVLFLPVAMAGMAWPSLSHWPKRLAETLTALIVSKVVIAGVLSLAAAAVTSALTQGGGAGGFAAIVTGVALLIVATICPFTLLRLVPATEAGAAAQLEAVRHGVREAARTPRQVANLAVDVMEASSQTMREGSSGGASSSNSPPSSGDSGRSGGSGGGTPGDSGTGPGSGGPTGPNGPGSSKGPSPRRSPTGDGTDPAQGHDQKSGSGTETSTVPGLFETPEDAMALFSGSSTTETNATNDEVGDGGGDDLISAYKNAHDSGIELGDIRSALDASTTTQVNSPSKSQNAQGGPGKAPAKSRATHGRPGG